MAEHFSNEAGAVIVTDLIAAINQNRQYLSDIDGQIGDGDHGINMAKGFNQTAEALATEGGGLSENLMVLGKTLMTNIGGSMGPLYGMLFRSASRSLAGKETIDAAVFAEMLDGIMAGLRKVSQAEVGDKTMMDALIPAIEAFKTSSGSFREALNAMADAAEKGRDSTEDMVSKIGRSSRLGERSRGVVDAGAASCAIILRTMASSAGRIITD